MADGNLRLPWLHTSPFIYIKGEKDSMNPKTFSVKIAVVFKRVYEEFVSYVQAFRMRFDRN